MSKIKVLIVEDDRLLSMFIADTVATMGYHVVGSMNSPLEALLNVSRLQPCTVLLNISQAGGHDDIEVAERIQDNHGVQVIFMTAHSDSKIRHRALKVSNGRLLNKPFEDLELKRHLEDICRLRSQ